MEIMILRSRDGLRRATRVPKVLMDEDSIQAHFSHSLEASWLTPIQYLIRTEVIRN